jgi:(p)ppGpp synthase/HD superfamily hydrolase
MIRHNEQVARAILFAAHAHEGQIRKYTGEPYINHPISVANTLSKFTKDVNLITAAILHDTVEDTDASPYDIWRNFGGDVEYLVAGVTDPEIEGNRKTRKAAAKDHLAQGCSRIKTLKLADLVDNTVSIVQHDKNFAKTYLAEKRELMTVLVGGNDHLYRMVMWILLKGEESVGV